MHFAVYIHELCNSVLFEINIEINDKVDLSALSVMRFKTIFEIQLSDFTKVFIFKV